MSDGPTQEETELFDEIGNLADEVWDKSKDIAGTIADPKMISVILFKRLRSHYIGYTVLWKNRCHIEGEIIVRSAIETAICIAANSKMGNEFPRMMRRDAAATLKGQIKHLQAEGDLESVQSAEAALHFLEATFADGEKSAYLNWKSLAETGEVPVLYGFYKMLSGMSSHVTGISIIRGVGDEETQAAQAKLLALSKRNYFNMMAGAGLNGSLIHAGMIDDTASVENAVALIHRMDDLSKSWLEVADV